MRWRRAAGLLTAGLRRHSSTCLSPLPKSYLGARRETLSDPDVPEADSKIREISPTDSQIGFTCQPQASLGVSSLFPAAHQRHRWLTIVGSVTGDLTRQVSVPSAIHSSYMCLLDRVLKAVFAGHASIHRRDMAV